MSLQYSETPIHGVNLETKQITLCGLGGMQCGIMDFTPEEYHFKKRICEGCMHGKPDKEDIQNKLKKLKEILRRK